MPCYNQYFSPFKAFTYLALTDLCRGRLGIMIPSVQMRTIETLGCKCLTECCIVPRRLNLHSDLLMLFRCQMPWDTQAKNHNFSMSHSSYYNFHILCESVCLWYPPSAAKPETSLSPFITLPPDLW